MTYLCLSLVLMFTLEREQIAGGSDEENAWRQFIVVESIYHVELARQAKCL